MPWHRSLESVGGVAKDIVSRAVPVENTGGLLKLRDELPALHASTVKSLT
jgi:hypothetical protein